MKKDKYSAELIGIILGDGNLGKYPNYRNKLSGEPRCHYLRIYCSLDEVQYSDKVRVILNKVFNRKIYTHVRKSENILYLEVSKKNLDVDLGLPIGDKIKNLVTIPDWIKVNDSLLIKCLRGLFDTDGCCYIVSKKYRVINFTSHNSNLLKDIDIALKQLRFKSYVRGFRNVEIGKKVDVDRFFSIIKPRNKKHYKYKAR